MIVFLASDYSSYMTGEVVSVSSQHPEEAPTMVDRASARRRGRPLRDGRRARQDPRVRPRRAGVAPGVLPPATPRRSRRRSSRRCSSGRSSWPGSNPWALVKMDQKRGMHAEQEYVFHGPPPRAGTRLTCQSRIAEVYEKEGRRGGNADLRRDGDRVPRRDREARRRGAADRASRPRSRPREGER